MNFVDFRRELGSYATRSDNVGIQLQVPKSVIGIEN